MNSLDNPKRLHIGVLLDSFEVSNWEFQMLREIHDSTFARIELVVSNSASAESYGPTTNVMKRPGRLFYSLFRRLNRFLFRAEPDAFERRDASSMLADAPRWSITPKQTRFSDYSREYDLARVERYETDVGSLA